MPPQRGMWAAFVLSVFAWGVVWAIGGMQRHSGPAVGASAADRTAAFRTEEVRFTSGGHALAGTLVLPAVPGPYPAVAFVHGSGALGRNDWTLHPALQEDFARHGIASLCWDKPGVGKSEGDWTQQSFRDRAGEALDAVEFLRRRREIDAAHVGLWGISQGGWVCPLAASLSPDVAFVILVSAPTGTIAQQDLFRVEQGMRADGMANEQIDSALGFARQRIALIKAGSFEKFDAAQNQAADRPWFAGYVHRLGPKEFAFGAKNIDYDGVPVLAHVRCPVLVIVGGRDTIVPSKEGATVVKRLLTEAGNRDVTVRTFPQADHFLYPTKTGGPREMAADPTAPTLAPGYLAALTDWLGDRVLPPMAFAERAVRHMREGDWQAAADSYAIIIRSNPYRAEDWHNLAYAQYKVGRYERAIEAWRKAAELGFAWDPIWERGLVWDKAWVAGFGPGTPLPWFNIARAQARLGRHAEALLSLRRALDEGFAGEEALRLDPDLAPLRDDPRFRSLTGLFPPEGLSRDDRWRFDLDYLGRRLDQMRWKGGDSQSQDRLRNGIRSLADQVPTLNDRQIVIEIQRAMASAGDGHTRLWWPSDGPLALPRWPIEFYLYSDGLFVRGASQRLAQTIGARVVQIGDRPAEDALKAVEPLCSADGPMGFKAEAPRLLALPDVLRAAGVVEDTQRVPLLVERADGTRTTVQLRAEPPGSEASAKWLSINSNSTNPLPALLRHAEKNYWFEAFPEDRLVYMQYNAVSDQQDESLTQFTRRMMAFVRANRIEYLAIDLRHNGGGNGLLNRALIRELVRNESIDARGHLFVIVGRDTFSAAMAAATDLARQTECVFVGEPSCSSPNARGQANPIRLPCSGLHLTCASLYYQGALLSSDRRPWVAPDIVAEPSSTDAADNRDPALAAILGQIRGRQIDIPPAGAGN